MNSKEVTIARIYMLEGHDHFDQILEVLRDEEAIQGVTVLRGIEGFGSDKTVHTSSLLVLSLELPLIIEFYDEPQKVAKAIAALKTKLDLKHIVSWQARLH